MAPNFDPNSFGCFPNPTSTTPYDPFNSLTPGLLVQGSEFGNHFYFPPAGLLPVTAMMPTGPDSGTGEGSSNVPFESRFVGGIPTNVVEKTEVDSLNNSMKTSNVEKSGGSQGLKNVRDEGLDRKSVIRAPAAKKALRASRSDHSDSGKSSRRDKSTSASGPSRRRK